MAAVDYDAWHLSDLVKHRRDLERQRDETANALERVEATISVKQGGHRMSREQLAHALRVGAGAGVSNPLVPEPERRGFRFWRRRVTP
jgi:hypothetical protein